MSDLKSVLCVNETGTEFLVPCIPGQTSDGYHTFDELYQHRNLLYLAFLWRHSDWGGGWRSRKHDDGSSYEGWFIVGTSVNSMQISYHLPDELWDYCDWLTEYPQAPKWDGHTPQDVVERLAAWLKSKGGDRP
jgi:hypothetical protein